MSAKKHTVRVTILNEEYAIRSETPPEHTRAVALYLDQAIRKVMSSGAVVLAALQITAELFDARKSLDATQDSIRGLSDYIRPLLPPAKRQAGQNGAE